MRASGIRTSAVGRSAPRLDVRRRISSVQYLENSAIALRAAHYVLAHEGNRHRFLLFPMVHIGTPDYYKQVRSRLAVCDMILFEGVSTFSSRLLTLSYRLMVKRRRLNLVTQDVLGLKDLAPKLISADVTSTEFDENWSRIPLHMRMALAIGAPILGAYWYLTATRDSIGRHVNAEDIKAHRELESREAAPAVHSAIQDIRDAKLKAAIAAVVAEPDPPENTGVIYGGGHMSSVTDLLMSKHRFRVVHAEWLTVFDYADV